MTFAEFSEISCSFLEGLSAACPELEELHILGGVTIRPADPRAPIKITIFGKLKALTFVPISFPGDGQWMDEIPRSPSLTTLDIRVDDSISFKFFANLLKRTSSPLPFFNTFRFLRLRYKLAVTPSAAVKWSEINLRDGQLQEYARQMLQMQQRIVPDWPTKPDFKVQLAVRIAHLIGVIAGEAAIAYC